MLNLENPIQHLLEPGTLWQTIQARTVSAIANGSLLSIPTNYEIIEQDGLSFLVRTLANLQRKETAKVEQLQQTAATGKPSNPFLPYEQNLFVADLSPTHVAILNKFNVVDHHLLIITRAFEPQENALTAADFAALWTGLTEIDGLAFYNGGKVAGSRSSPASNRTITPYKTITACKTITPYKTITACKTITPSC
jgi:sulfate adenylyltransferase (ADP) / ATP adenylyltransferase